VGAISAFWLGLLLGRVLFLLHRGPVDARLLGAAGLGAALVLAGGAALDVRAIELWVAVVGLLLGLVFPVFVMLTALRFPAARGTATGLVTGAGAAGGFLVPWLTGVLGDARGVRVAFASLAAWCLALALAAALARRGERASRWCGSTRPVVVEGSASASPRSARARALRRGPRPEYARTPPAASSPRRTT
jgi:fucose permease